MVAPRFVKLFAVAVSAAFACSMAGMPAYALTDTNLDEGMTGTSTGVSATPASADESPSLQSQPSADQAESMPDNPTKDLPQTVSKEIPDDATVVSEELAVTDAGEVMDLETGDTVTDPQIVGTVDKPADPLAKTDGESFIPVEVAEVKETMGDAATVPESDDAADTAETEGDDDVAESQQNAADEGATGVVVRPASLQNNSYGAYWGTYNGTQAFFEADGTLFAQQAKGVIDVSQWQGQIDWQKVKNAGVGGAIIRISYGWGNGVDVQARRNISECKRLGIPFGVYSYSYAENAAGGTAEGADIVNLLRQAGVNPGDLSYPVFYDLEQWTWTGHTPPTSSSVYDGIVNSWYAQLQAAGYTNLSVYSYTNYLNTALNSSNIRSKTRWVASYGARTNFPYSTNDRGWQYTSGGSIDGIEGRVDLNAFGNKEFRASFNVTRQARMTVPDGVYYINSYLKDSSSLGIAGGATENGAATRLNSYNKSDDQQFRFERQDDGSYVITNVASGKVLDVSGGATGNGVTVQQYEANGTAAQRWYLRDADTGGYYLQSALGNWVLDIANASTADGTSIRLYEPNASDAQKFMLASVVTVTTDKTVQICSKLGHDLMLDVRGESTDNGAKIQTWTWNKADSQIYILHAVGNGVYTIQNVHSQKMLEAASGNTGNGTAVQQWASNSTQSQHWLALDAGSGYLRFYGSKSGKYMDVTNASTSTGTGIQIWEDTGSPAQEWQIVESQDARGRLDALASENRSVLADGWYRVSSHGSSAVLDVSNGSSADGANVQLWRWDGVDQQVWRVSHDEKGYVTLTNARSGKALDVDGGLAVAGRNVQQWRSDGVWAQKWVAVPGSDGRVRLISGLGDRFALDADCARTKNGTNVHLWTDNGGESQQWKFIETLPMRGRLDALASENRSVLADGWYRVSSHGSSAVLDVSNGSSADGANVQLWRWDGVDQQVWRVSHDEKGYVTLTNARSGKALDVDGGLAVAGRNVQQWRSDGVWAQKWVAVPGSDGRVRLISGLGDRFALDADCARTADGTNVHLWTDNGGESQQWEFTEARD